MERERGGRRKVGERKQGKRNKNKKGEGDVKVIFWNVARLGNKNGDFWEGIRKIGCNLPNGNVDRRKGIKENRRKAVKGVYLGKTVGKKK